MKKKILIIRFSSIGDIVLTTPVIRCLKTQIDAEIHFLTKESFEKILNSNPHISKVWFFEKKITEILKDLKAEKFDHIIDLHNNLRSFQVKNSLKTSSFSFNKLNFKKWLIVNLKINRLPKQHIVDRYLDTVKPLGVKNDDKGLDFFIPKEDEFDIKNFIKTNFTHQLPPQYFNSNFNYIAFVIGAAHATKRLPPDKIISICSEIQLPILLLGGREDIETGEIIASKSKTYVFNLCGKLNLNQSAWVVKQAHKVVTHDTGLMHIAAAFHKNIISVWGNTIPELGMTAYTEGVSVFEVKDLKCRPCSKIGYNECPKGHFKCMTEQDIMRIAKSAND